MKYLFQGLSDIFSSLNKFLIYWTLAVYDMRQRYIRSILGPFWYTLNTSIIIIGLSLVFGAIFQLSLKQFLPYLAFGIILWNFIFGMITECGDVFLNNKTLNLQFDNPASSNIIRLFLKNIFIFFHQLMIFPLIYIIFEIDISLITFSAFFGFLLLIANLFWICLIVSILCMRYRDISMIIANLMQLLFFITPVIWKAEMMLDKNRQIFVDLNPFYHLLEIVRSPLLGFLPEVNSIIFTTFSALIGNVIALFVLGIFKNKINYWY